MTSFGELPISTHCGFFLIVSCSGQRLHQAPLNDVSTVSGRVKCNSVQRSVCPEHIFIRDTFLRNDPLANMESCLQRKLHRRLRGLEYTSWTGININVELLKRRNDISDSWPFLCNDNEDTVWTSSFQRLGLPSNHDFPHSTLNNLDEWLTNRIIL